MAGTDGNDYLVGTYSNDYITGKLGNDTLVGSVGNDTMDGGAGIDYAYFSVDRSKVNIINVSRDSSLGFTLTDPLFNVTNLQNIEHVLLNGKNYDVDDLIYGHDAIHRFFNKKTGVHFYTASIDEATTLKEAKDSDLRYEGVSFQASESETGTANVYRFLNTSTGTHFYTSSDVEKEAVQKLSTFSYEGVAYKAFNNSSPGTSPLYRLFNTATGAHFYTASEAEMSTVSKTTATYRYEGVAYWIYATS
ncbi:hypothetical protein GBZ48_18325 [Azospirillum melinis]|uniref:DUF5648 domain-containing protein n=1 Tax=Azospirillum melinis TaxID=328839 RepID=A0ABX2KEU1_9PROT|nr:MULTISPECIES: hypothetical protein [Azospirillum]MBP2309706.1 hypothetical protein [Azospirillum melinis]NUB01228.1 hypothetical protein [Azospirillum melinis]